MAQCKELGGVEGSSPMSRKLGVKGSHESRLLTVEGSYNLNIENVNIETMNLWVSC